MAAKVSPTAARAAINKTRIVGSTPKTNSRSSEKLFLFVDEMEKIILRAAVALLGVVLLAPYGFQHFKLKCR